MKSSRFLATAFFALVPSLATGGAAAIAGPAATPVKCAIPKPCAMYTNSNTGAGAEGVSAGGAGLLGSSGSGMFVDAGVDGESTNQSGNDAGGVFGGNVFSTGVAPFYGAVAFGSGFGLVGQSYNDGTQAANPGFGVLGQDIDGTAGGGDYNIGVLGKSTVGTGVLGESNGTPVISVYGESPVGVYAVARTATGTINPNAFAVFAETNSFGIDIHNTSSGATGFFLAPSDLINVSSGSGEMYVDLSGNELLSGTLTTSKGGPCVQTTGASGTAMTEYAERTTTPQVEDVGEAQLANGRAYVAIDARLADTIDHRTAYHVFVTPEGDCNGLFVTRKSGAGFEVRELRGGRSSLAFEYRIVARPVDEAGQRLPFAAPLRRADDDGMKTGRAVHPPAPVLSPQERLKRQLGTQAYAAMLTALRARALPQH